MWYSDILPEEKHANSRSQQVSRLDRPNLGGKELTAANEQGSC